MIAYLTSEIHGMISKDKTLSIHQDIFNDILDENDKVNKSALLRIFLNELKNIRKSPTNNENTVAPINGINNERFYCYQNVVLQILSNLGIQLEPINDFVKMIQKVFNEINSSNINPVYPPTLLRERFQKERKIAIRDQHDAEEFLTFISDNCTQLKNMFTCKVTETIDRCPNKKCTGYEDEKRVIFEEIKYQIKIFLPIKNFQSSIQELIKNYETQVEDHCKFCSEKYNIKFHYRVESSAKFLSIQLGIYDYNTNIKYNYTGVIDDKITINELKCELNSIVAHSGLTLNGGHYICYRKIDGKWWKCDDGKIPKVINDPNDDLKEIGIFTPYLIFYKISEKPNIGNFCFIFK